MIIPNLSPANWFFVGAMGVFLGIPLSILAYGIYLGLRRIPFRPAQCLVPLIAGMIAVVTYAWMDPSNPSNPGFLMFLIGMVIHPLLVLPPIMIMQGYLRHIPARYGVFFTAFISLAFLIAGGAVQGDIRVVEDRDLVLQSLRTVIADLIIATGASGLIIGLDRFVLPSGKE